MVEFYKLCGACSTTFASAPLRTWKFAKMECGERYPRETYTLHSSLEAFQASLQAGCHFCAMVEYILAKSVPPGTLIRGISLTTNPRDMLARLASECVPGPNPNFMRGIKIQPDLDPVPLGGYRILANLRLRATPGPQRPPLPDPIGNAARLWDSTSSQAHMELARHWVDTCIGGHPDCPHPNLDFVPTRLLEISDNATHAQLKTMREADRGTRYCALSHCWGGVSDIITLTSTTQPVLEAGVPTSALAKTFQDAAIVAAVAVGVKHLWIDSLCILQDSKEDWIQESSRMALVYQNSACTIAAAGAPNSHHGCFSRRNPLPLNPCIITGSIDDGVVVFHDSDNSVAVTQEKPPLFERAWVLQEQMLSPRTLYFGSETLWWGCMSGWANEADNRVRGTNWYARSFDKMQQTVQSDQSHQEKLHNLHYEWFETVSRYTKRAITKGSDKLIALSAVAHRAKTITGFHYLAGLWNESLIYDLHWSIYLSSHCKARPMPYRAPTWSWASVDGHASGVYFGEGDGFLMADVVSAETTTHELDTHGTGSVTGGSLVLAGNLMELPFADLASSWKGSKSKPWPGVFCRPDIKFEADERTEAHLVPLLAWRSNRGQNSKFWVIQGIALRRLVTGASYERFGWFSCECADGFGGEEDVERWRALGKTTVTIL